jgi:hypothetical protein
MVKPFIKKHYPSYFIMPIHCLRTLPFLFLLFAVLSAKAQSLSINNQSRIPQKYGSFNLSAGMIFMPAKTASHLLGQRPSVGFHQGYRFNYAFNKDWLAYGALGINYYRSQRPAILDPTAIGIHAEDILEAIFRPIENIKPTLDAGVMYRLKIKNWEILPALGFSYTVDDWGRDRELTLDNGVHLHYKMQGDVPGIKWGVNAHYWVSKKAMLLLGLQAEQPLQKPNASAIYLRGDDIMKSEKIRSSAYGRNLYFEVGYGFSFARRY